MTPPALRRATTPLFRPPREVAAQAAELAESGQDDAARRLLSSAAQLRPDQEVASLITTLRGDHRHGDAETVIGAAARRPAAEVAALAGVLRQIGVADDADRVLDQAGFRSPAEIGPLAGVLAEQDRMREVRRLLRSAITVHRAPAAVVALVAALSSAGLGPEIARLMNLVGAGMPDADAIELADALRAAGQDNAAFRLYTYALGPVSLRAPDQIASLLAAMRRAGAEEDADRLISAVSSVSREPDQVAELAASLWSAALDGDSRRVLDAAVSTMAVDQVTDIAGWLLAMDRAGAALSLCIGAAARHPVGDCETFVRILRDAGRPVDAQVVLDSTRDWPAAKAARLIVALRAGDADADAERVLAASQTREAAQINALMIELISLGADEDCVRVAGLAKLDDPAVVCELAAEIARQGRRAVAEDVLFRAAADSPEFCCDLIAELMRGGWRSGVDTLLELVALSDNASIRQTLAWLRTRGNDEAANQLLTCVASRPAEEAASFAGELSMHQAAEVIALIAAMKLVRPQDIGQVLLAALPGLGAQGAEFLLALAADRRVGVATVAAVLEVRLPGYGAPFFELVVFRYHGAGAKLGEVVTELRGSRLASANRVLLATAATHLNPIDFRALYRNLRTQYCDEEANYLLAQGWRNLNVPLLVTTLRDGGYQREARQLRRLYPRR